MIWELIIYVAVAIFVVYKLVTVIVPRFVLVPPQHWQDKIQKVLDHEKPIYLPVGPKKLAYRRRLILALKQPSFYTNFVNNKLKIWPQDKQDKAFPERMKIRGVEDFARPILYGFFHPYANNGGGGERVLWSAVKATLTAKESNIVAIYTTNVDAEPLEILAKAEAKFNISGLDSRRIVFIYLRRFSKLIDADYCNHFTLVGQLLGTMLLAFEALYQLSPDVWIDTQGLPGANLIAHSALHIPILNYVHYPILQKEMFAKLKFSKISDLTKFSSVGDVKELAKFVYWLTLYYFYTYLGSLVSVALTNGTWTYTHLTEVWSFCQAIGVLYPPCGDFEERLDLNKVRDNKMLYIAQFRPEKRHTLILEQYAKFLQENKTVKPANIPSLVFLGSCRTKDDTVTLENVKEEAKRLNLTVEFVVDCLYQELKEWLQKCTYGLNAMWNEHFGIGVVEYLDNGLIPVVHASAGPYLDIVTDEADKVKNAEKSGNEESVEKSVDWYNDAGFFFKDTSDPDWKGDTNKEGLLEFGNKSFPTFSRLLQNLVTSPELTSAANLASMRRHGQELTAKFSDERFMTSWMDVTSRLEMYERHLRDARDNVEQVY